MEKRAERGASEPEPNIFRIDNESADVRFALSNSFGFGGSNCSLLFARSRHA